MRQDTLVHDEESAVDPSLPPDPARRFWITTTCAVGGVAGVATVVPFVSTFAPSAKARAAGAPVEVDVADLAPGQMRTVEWRGKPVWILRRSKEQIAALKTSDALVADPNSNRPGYTPEYAKNEYRSRKADLFVCVGICTHLGCSPTPQLSGGPAFPGDTGGFNCPCHGSTFDLAGRVYANKPAPDNLEVPPYEYLSDTRIIVGVDEDNKA
ncbi:MAG: ubiquinol-cytochrome c reductase iron-sulfur subunit [Alcaligenaceae bacterium]|nr:MAG: ubiquinol-cytochrome c reductase iron-sulfur subunit [Alcaligenaceae bacterium]